MSENSFARGVEFEETAVYYPAVRPGYVGWVNTFQYGNGELSMAFNEIRREKNPRFKPAPLENIEAMALPYRYLPAFFASANPNLVSEYVYVKSSDAAKTWRPVGRCPAPCRHAYHAGFPDGRMVRAWAGGVWSELVSDRWSIRVEESFDHGNTWRPIAELMEGFGWFPHRLKKLRDNTLILSGAAIPTFGKNGFVPQRSSQYDGQMEYYMSAFFASGDGGYHWTGPHYVLPRTGGHEFDFAELPNGDLLFFLSTIQSNKPARQIVHRIATGFVNDPLMEVRRGSPTDDNPEGGFTPETIAATGEELLIGGRRCKPYVCSNDLGENWYEIAEIPFAEYQPMMQLLPDGRVLTAWHHGSDSLLGEVDMYIGTHAFRVEHHLPTATRLTLDRKLSDDKSRYVNTFEARLTAKGKPLSNRQIELKIKNTWRPQPDGRENPVALEDSPDVRKAVTDSDGIARFILTDKDHINDIHHGYQLVTRFTPQPGDTFSGCRSPNRFAYPLAPARNDPAPFPIYNAHGIIMVTPETAKRFPELAQIIDHFKTPNPDATFEQWVQVTGNEKRTRELLDFLLENHILSRDKKGIYHWYRAVHSGGPGEPYIHGLRICSVEEYCE